jgi:hypothetical protein
MSLAMNVTLNMSGTGWCSYGAVATVTGGGGDVFWHALNRPIPTIRNNVFFIADFLSFFSENHRFPSHAGLLKSEMKGTSQKLWATSKFACAVKVATAGIADKGSARIVRRRHAPIFDASRSTCRTFDAIVRATIRVLSQVGIESRQLTPTLEFPAVFAVTRADQEKPNNAEYEHQRKKLLQGIHRHCTASMPTVSGVK